MGEYTCHNRGGVGMRNYKVTEKTGKLVGVKAVTGDEDLLLISDDGTIIRMAVSSIRPLSRSTQGVRLMRLTPGSRLISVEKTESSQDAVEAENSEEITEDENG
jgi:DNA gyrase subunit A